MEIKHRCSASLSTLEDRQKFAALLPEVPRPGMKDWIKKEFYDSELGGDFCVFTRKSICVEDKQIGRTMSADDWKRYESNAHYHWAAECHCTACGMRFITGWNKNHPNKRYGIRMYAGDDGENYDGYIPENALPDVDFMPYNEDEKITCPRCGERISLIHRSRLKHGRTYQMLVTSIEAVDNYTVLMTWRARRYIGQWNPYNLDDFFEILPREALVIDGRKAYRFKHSTLPSIFSAEVQLGEWEPTNYYNDDLAYHRYYDYNAGGSYKIDAVVYRNVPDLTGTTGEKTGLAEYVDGHIERLEPLIFAYLKMYRKHPNIENVVKSKWRTVLDSELRRLARNENYAYSAKYSVDTDLFNFNEKAPHKMLGVSKQSLKHIVGWTCEDLREYNFWKFTFENVTEEDFDDWLGFFDGSTLHSLAITLSDYDDGYNYKKVINYLIDQSFLTSANVAAQTWVDYRDMLGGGEHTYREIFPKNIIQAHDDLVERTEAEKQSKYEAKFTELAEKYSALEWTDGDLCIRIAQNEQELIDEGKVLHHCVGGYGHKHASESDVIFFVRHYRRPERSYYTLDINMTGSVPCEVQLHGYRNELYPSKHFRQSRIPQRVRDFCDRWEKEILIPTVAKMRKEQSTPVKRRKEKVA